MYEPMFGYDDEYYDEISPEDSRFMVYDSKREEWDSVFDVPFWRRWWRFVSFDWEWKVAGRFYRFRRKIGGCFQRCVHCGKRGFKMYWFSDVCSEQCAIAMEQKLRQQFDGDTSEAVLDNFGTVE